MEPEFHDGDRKAKRGIAAICIGGGESVAMLVEKVE